MAVNSPRHTRSDSRIEVPRGQQVLHTNGTHRVLQQTFGLLVILPRRHLRRAPNLTGDCDILEAACSTRGFASPLAIWTATETRIRTSYRGTVAVFSRTFFTSSKVGARCARPYSVMESLTETLLFETTSAGSGTVYVPPSRPERGP